MAESISLWDFAVYLDSVRALYPGGIPEHFIGSPPKTEEKSGRLSVTGGRGASLLFVGMRSGRPGGFAGREGELLAAAVTKGMKLPLEAVCLIDIFGGLGKSDDEGAIKIALQGELERVEPRLIVALGDEVVGLLDVETSPGRGEWSTWRRTPLMVTHRLQDVLAVISVKKEFWSDLQ